MLSNAPDRWKCWLDAALGFFYPEACQYCGSERATTAEGFIGANCRENVKPIKPPFCERCGLPFEGQITTRFECSNCRNMELHFSHARSAVAAKGMVLDLIHRYKYAHALWLEPFLAGLLTDAAAPSLQNAKWDMIIPVPLHPQKEREREFNQAERLARSLSRATSISVRKDLLCRVTPTETQTRLSRVQRAKNVRGAFACKKPGNTLDGKRVVLVDDVLTTGATTSACAKILSQAGASDICVWTLARGLLN